MSEVEKQILLITQEECAEVTQAISKIFRFGYDAVYPINSNTNRQKLAEEVGDLMCMIDIMMDNSIIDYEEMNDAKQKKYEKLRKWSKIFNDEKANSI